MDEISKTGNGFVVDASVIARAFRITAEQVRDDMHSGRISSRTEIGVDKDEGRWRMTFYRGERAFRLVVDAEGQVLTRGSFPVTPRSPAVRLGPQPKKGGDSP
ncbi:DUF6522 family protein [Salipiger mucosus]|uniref:DUF6522 family protein n=1 Tax=Salipiger mucosus TaxID=263378 RepID=UPI0003642E02|nr:DUF6522 family protein [Salipiger mucosus]